MTASFAWNFFAQLDKDKASCIVNGCGKVLCTKGGSTGSIIKHLFSQHGINKNNFDEMCIFFDKPINFLKFSA